MRHSRFGHRLTQLGTGLLALCFAAVAQAMEPSVLFGPPFSDPSHVESMPEDWQQKPLQRPAGFDLAITLDQHLYPALLPLIDDYAAQHHLSIAVQEGTCGISAGALMDRKADIAGFCCPAGSTDRLPGLRFHTIGIASLALITHPTNPLRNLSLEQVRGLFRGHLAYWDQLGIHLPNYPADTLVVAVGRLHCKTRPGHWRLLLSNEDKFSPRLLETSTIPDMISDVAGNPAAIGYEAIWMTRRFADKGKVNMLNVDGVSPLDDAALIAGRYPLYRTFNITTWDSGAAANGQADALVRYLMDNVEKIDPRYGIVPATRLRQAGWKFHGEELIGEPR